MGGIVVIDVIMDRVVVHLFVQRGQIVLVVVRNVGHFVPD